MVVDEIGSAVGNGDEQVVFVGMNVGHGVVLEMCYYYPQPFVVEFEKVVVAVSRRPVCLRIAVGLADSLRHSLLILLAARAVAPNEWISDRRRGELMAVLRYCQDDGVRQARWCA